jgi:phosphoglycolate phosphatase
MRHQLAIFDFDGTLADSGDWFLSILPQVATRYGFRVVAPDEVEMLRGRTSREVIAYLGIPGWKLPFIARHVRAMGTLQAEHVRLFAGIPEMFVQLAEAGVRIAIVTSNAEANVRRILGPEIVARIGWFEGGSSLFGKAAKFRRVLRRAGMTASQAIAIGDETRDADAARAVGIPFGAVFWGYASDEAMLGTRPAAAFRVPADIAAYLLARHE